MRLSSAPVPQPISQTLSPLIDSEDAADAGRRIVGAFVHARMIAVKLGILLRRKERRTFAKLCQMLDVVAPDALRSPAESAGIAHKRRQDVLQHETNAVGGFSVH